MNLEAYFENTKGTGVMATADKDGKVDAAVYSRPHFLEDGTVAFIMRDRLTRSNLQTNPHAAYLFIEKGPGYAGKRLYLTKIREEEKSELLVKFKRRQLNPEETAEKGPLFLTVFQIDKELPLIGPGDEA
ncbi:MAG: pyridoxamine 5'-phosphate oxidase family protein [Desulfobacteraceae bacterium]|nr:MAG: pyridoxamine 5'-phosphate oxidase family protein [Desulfobacteraceae bacterium]